MLHVNLFVRTFHHLSICVFEHLSLRVGNFFWIIQISVTNLQHIKIAHSQDLKTTYNLLYHYKHLCYILNIFMFFFFLVREGHISQCQPTVVESKMEKLYRLELYRMKII